MRKLVCNLWTMTSGLVLGAAVAASAQSIRSHADDAFVYGTAGWWRWSVNQPYEGLSLGIGFRKERGPIGFDVSGSMLACEETRGLSSTDCSSSDLIPVGLEANVSGLYRVRTAFGGGPYVGAGLGGSASEFTNHVVATTTRWRRIGFHRSLSAGYEFLLRDRNRVFVQVMAARAFSPTRPRTVIHTRTPSAVAPPSDRQQRSLAFSIGFSVR